MQWQLIGDWSGDGPLDVDVDAIVVIKPDAEILGFRADSARREREEHDRRAAEQAATREKYGKRTELSPAVERVSLAAPSILAIEIAAGRVIPGTLEPYKPQPGDERLPRDKNRQLILKSRRRRDRLADRAQARSTGPVRAARGRSSGV